jgi:hypothetical protein
LRDVVSAHVSYKLSNREEIRAPELGVERGCPLAREVKEADVRDSLFNRIQFQEFVMWFPVLCLSERQTSPAPGYLAGIQGEA